MHHGDTNGFGIICEYVPVSVEPQPDLSCFVAGQVAELKSVPSVTAELQLAERGLG